MFKKLLLSFFVFMMLTFSFVPLASAQAETGKWYSQSFQEWITKVNDSPESEIFGERYTAAQVQWVIYGLFYFVLNMGTTGNTEVVTCLMNQDVEDCVDAIENLANPTSFKKTTEPISFLKFIGNSPISLSSSYLKDVGQRLRLVPGAKAQGVGYTTGASAALELWKITKNVSYAFLIVIIVIMAFMIMFRVKISPQVVIGVQSALPKIVMALILITFSYAIAGLLIDLMYVSMGLIAAIFVNNNITTLSWGEMFNRLVVERNVIELFLSYWFQFLISAIVNFVEHFLSTTGFISFLLIFFAIIAFFVLLWFSIKTVILLFKTYVQIILLIIIAPFQILLGVVLPNGGFGQWFKNMAAQLAVYPLVGLMLVLAFLFIRQSLPETILGLTQSDYFSPFDIAPGFLAGGQTWAPPLTVPLTVIQGQGDSSKLLWLLLSYGIIILIPKTAEIIQGFVSGKQFAFGTAIDEAVGAPGRAIVTGMGLTAGAGKAIEGLRAAGFIRGHPIESSQTGTSARLEKRLGEIKTSGVESVMR